MPSSPAARGLVGGISRFVFGTTRLGDAQLPHADRVRMARAAMDAGVWFHTSHTYGDALSVLRTAFDEDRARVPKLVYKIGWNDVRELRETIRLQLDALGLEHMDMGQLCLGGALAEELRTGGPCSGAFRQLREEGLVRSLVLEVFPWTSASPLDALRRGLLDGVVDGFIFYLNPLQRFASNALWDELQARGTPILALRTVGGGDVHRLRDVPGAAWKPYLQARAAEVAPIYERSGCASWPEFCARFALGLPHVQATIGATSRPEHLQELLAAVRDAIPPLPADLVSRLLLLHRSWSDATDVHAEPWSM
jgi:aryl-alcohol dehydrogenase-like predicted oxidoreductase